MPLPRPHAFAFALAFILALAPALRAADLHLAQGILVGEVTATTAILQTRLTATPGLDATGDVPGAAGVVRFELSTSESFAAPVPSTQNSRWLTARADADFIVRQFTENLRPATRYFYRVHYGPPTHTPGDASVFRRSATGSFKTLPAATAAAPVNFVLTSCLNYAFFRDGTRNAKSGKSTPGYTGPDRDLGYPALDPLTRLAPDFVIFAGDCVYYDHPAVPAAKTQAELRKKWHEQYATPRFVSLFSRTATYWQKDDHDHRKNDSDATGDYEPSHALGLATFREQVPLINPATPAAPTYRTHRIGRDLQLWFVEGRDFRSPNHTPDGPAKTLWGAEQLAWLKRTVAASDATFKILVSPTPLIGPDDAYKRDNHVSPTGFKHEGEAFLAWLRANNIKPGQFFIVSGDRHWKYHSQHPVHGFDELTCGALNRENSRLGRNPGDPQSTDPDAKVKQLYTDKSPSGGFLRIALKPALDNAPGARLSFTHYDDHGTILYEYHRSAP